MKCEVNCGELREALQTAMITVDKRAISDLRHLFVGAYVGGQNQRIIIHSSNSLSRTLARVPCSVKETGEIVIEPSRLLSILEGQNAEAMVSFSQDGKKHTLVKVGSARVSLSSVTTLVPMLTPEPKLFPFTTPSLFEMSSSKMRSLLSRTAAFVYDGDSHEGLKNVRIRSTETGYEAVSTNKIVLALARMEDPQTKGMVDGEIRHLDGSVSEGKVPAVDVAIPGYAVPSLLRLLAKQKEQTIKVCMHGNSVFFSTPDLMCGSQPSAVAMPQVDQLFQQTNMTTYAEVSKDQMLQALHRSDPFSHSINHGQVVRIDIKKDGVILSAKDGRDEFEEKITSQRITGESTGQFWLAHFSDVLRHAEEENIVINMGSAGERHVPAALLQTGGVNGASYVVAQVAA